MTSRIRPRWSGHVWAGCSVGWLLIIAKGGPPVPCFVLSFASMLLALFLWRIDPR